MELNVGLVVAAVAAAVPAREAVVWGDRRLDYATFLDRCRRLAAVLRAAGLGAHGDPAAVAPHEAAQDLVLLLMTNCPEYLEGMVGGYLARVAPTNVNYRYTADEVADLADDAGARAAIVHRRFAHLLPPRVGLVLAVDDGSDTPLPAGAVDYETALAGADPDLDASGPALDAAGRAPTPDDLYVVYTGGTTGSPKGVLWRQADFLAGALGVRGSYGSLAAAAAAAAPDRLRALPAPPLMHGAAHWNALSCLAAGGTVVLPERPERFDALDVLATIGRERCTSLNIVGDAFGIPLADALERDGRAHDVSSLRHVVTGGAVLSASTKRRLAAAVPGLRIVDIVGSSESGRQGVGTGTGAGRFRRSGGAVVLDERRRRVLPPDDPAIGWLATTGPIPRGYLGDPDRTAATFPVVDGVRYVVAGDRARWAPDGSGDVELLGREAATINTGGEKVFAEEVEAVVRAHPAVADAVVVGRPSERWGNEVVAVVALRDDVDDDDLRAACAGTLARYKLPKAFVRVDAVQRTPSGKSDYAWARSVVGS